MEQLRRLQVLVMNTSNKPAQTGTCILVWIPTVCQQTILVQYMTNEQQLLDYQSENKLKDKEVDATVKCQILIVFKPELNT